MSAYQALINALSQASFYSDSPANETSIPADSLSNVRRIETHISIVFLTGELAYKLKKPVNFGFLDFSDLTKRREYCELEVELNRRTAPDLYLGVIPVYQSLNAPYQTSLKPLPGLVITDYLVKMRQFDPEKVLGSYIQQHPLTDQQQVELADAIADLHTQADVVTAGNHLGSPACVLEPMTDNFPTLLTLFDSENLNKTLPTLDPSALKNRLHQLELWTRNQHTLLSPMIEQRQQNGFVRACHGDLHLDNITLIDDKPMLFDGIEFNDQFRWIDTLSDLAFLLIDLDHRNHSAMALNLLNLYLRKTGDYSGLVLLRFYQTYRALVRAKITGLRYLQLDPLTQKAQQTLATVLDYIALAENYAYLDQAEPTLYIMHGVSGSGKSTVAGQIQQQTGALVISSDLERKRLYGITPQTRVSAAEKSKLYGLEMNEATHNAVYNACVSALQAGLSVIADATFLRASHRERYIELAKQMQRDYLIVAIETNQKLAERWLAKRTRENKNVSDANVSIMHMQLASVEPPEADEHTLILPMGQDLPELSKRSFKYEQ